MNHRIALPCLGVTLLSACGGGGGGGGEPDPPETLAPTIAVPAGLAGQNPRYMFTLDTASSEDLQFTGLPFFAPEMFRTVEVADPLKTKQLRAGLTQLGEEGAIQVFRPVAATMLLLGAVGQLQFEVVAHRLEHEYGVKARITPARYNVARWVTCDEADGGERELKRFIDGNAHRVALDAVDAPCVLLEYAGELRAMQENWPKIRFHALREHAGLVFQKQLDG